MTLTSVAPLYTGTGVFVALEGGEGAGKSTQSCLLDERLRADGCTTVLTREPGGTKVGLALRAILLDPATGALSPRTEALLYAADKAEHVDTVLLPALAEGSVVVTDRYVDSSLAYQGAGRALALDDLRAVMGFATANLRPHLTVLLDVDPAAGLTRVQDGNDSEFEGLDRIEAESIEFHQRVRATFRDLAAADPEHYLVLDARSSVEDIHEAIMAAVVPWLSQARLASIV